MLRLLVLAALIACTLQACTCGGPCNCQPLESKEELLSQADWFLYWMGLNGHLKDCRIVSGRNSGSGCAGYVQSSIHGEFPYRGYPLDTDCRGTGCIFAPGGVCWYSKPNYSIPIQLIAPTICTDNSIANAAAMLRHAIVNDACDCQI